MKFSRAGDEIQNSVGNLPRLGARYQSTAPSDAVRHLRVRPLIGDVHYLVLCVERDALCFREHRVLAFQDAKRCVLSLSILWPHDHRGWMLHRDKELLRCFINGYAESAMGSF